MNNNIKFSIIIPAYNAQDYIDACLNSIMSQTYTNYEIIVIDDCSTDNTYEILKQYNNISLLKTKINSRQGAARNIGLNNCSGDYVIFLDSDDCLSKDTNLEELSNIVINNNNPDIIYFGMHITGSREMSLIPDSENTNKSYRLAKNPFINVTSICWKNDLLQKNNIRFPEDIKYEDVYFAFLGIEKSSNFTYTDSIFYEYNNRNNSTTTSYTLSQSIDTIKLIDKLFTLFDKIDVKNYPLLFDRIKQQADRVPARLSRAIDTKQNELLSKKISYER